MTDYPLITCLCLTRNRREWLKKAIACYEAQTYQNKELLIIADDVPDVELVPLPDSARVFLSGPLNVGRKRNFGNRLAQGEIIAHWDDDDYSAPERLTSQLAHLKATGKAVTGYHGMKVTDGKNWWQYRCAAPTGFAFATSLCYLKSFWERHNFEPLQTGQDEAFSSAAVREKQLASQPDMNLMYFTAHPGNTSPRKLTEKGDQTFVRLPGFDRSIFENFSWPIAS